MARRSLARPAHDTRPAAFELSLKSTSFLTPSSRGMLLCYLRRSQPPKSPSSAKDYPSQTLRLAVRCSSWSLAANRAHRRGGSGHASSYAVGSRPGRAGGGMSGGQVPREWDLPHWPAGRSAAAARVGGCCRLASAPGGTVETIFTRTARRAARSRAVAPGDSATKSASG